MRRMLAPILAMRRAHEMHPMGGVKPGALFECKPTPPQFYASAKWNFDGPAAETHRNAQTFRGIS